MSALAWQKSSFSGSGQDNCLEVAADNGGSLHLRESEDPETVLTPDSRTLRGLLGNLKGTAFDVA